MPYKGVLLMIGNLIWALIDFTLALLQFVVWVAVRRKRIRTGGYWNLLFACALAFMGIGRVMLALRNEWSLLFSGVGMIVLLIGAVLWLVSPTRMQQDKERQARRNRR